MKKAVGERDVRVDLLEVPTARLGILAAVEHITKRPGDIDRVAGLRRQAQRTDTALFELAEVVQQIGAGMGQCLHAIVGQEFLVVERPHHQPIRILVADKAAIVLGKAVHPRVIAARGNRKRHTAEPKHLNGLESVGGSSRDWRSIPVRRERWKGSRPRRAFSAARSATGSFDEVLSENGASMIVTALPHHHTTMCVYFESSHRCRTRSTYIARRW